MWPTSKFHNNKNNFSILKYIFRHCFRYTVGWKILHLKMADVTEMIVIIAVCVILFG